MIEIYQNTLGQNCIMGINEDGSSWSMLKSVYDEQQAKEAALLEKPTAKK